jgi:hypothetical protein
MTPDRKDKTSRSADDVSDDEAAARAERAARIEDTIRELKQSTGSQPDDTPREFTDRPQSSDDPA